MNTLAEMRTAVQSDLNVSSNSSLFTPTRIDASINRAYQKAGGMFRWPALEDAQITDTQTDQDYYDLPTTWSPDSAWRLKIGDDVYGEEPDGNPMDFRDFLDWKDNDLNANSTEKKWAVQWLRFFVYPTPTAVGDGNITVWGQKRVEELTEDTDTTIFSYNLPECNEAIVLEAVSILKRKGENDNTANTLSLESKQILAVAFNKIRQEQAKYEKTQPMLNVPDMFSKKGTVQNTGNFD